MNQGLLVYDSHLAQDFACFSFTQGLTFPIPDKYSLNFNLFLFPDIFNCISLCSLCNKCTTTATDAGYDVTDDENDVDDGNMMLSVYYISRCRK